MKTAKDMSNRVLYIADLLNKMESKVRIFRLDEERRKRGQTVFSESDAETIVHRNLDAEFSGRLTVGTITQAKERASRLLRQGIDMNEALRRARSWILCADKSESNNVA